MDLEDEEVEVEVESTPNSTAMSTSLTPNQRAMLQAQLNLQEVTNTILFFIS